MESNDFVKVTEQNMVVENEKEAPVFYSNAINLKFGIYDFQLFLGQETVVENKPYVKVLAKVVLSPQHAKVVAQMLAENVKRYEEVFGEIKLPAEPFTQVFKSEVKERDV